MCATSTAAARCHTMLCTVNEGAAHKPAGSHVIHVRACVRGQARSGSCTGCPLRSHCVGVLESGGDCFSERPSYAMCRWRVKRGRARRRTRRWRAWRTRTRLTARSFHDQCRSAFRCVLRPVDEPRHSTVYGYRGAGCSRSCGGASAAMPQRFALVAVVGVSPVARAHATLCARPRRRRRFTGPFYCVVTRYCLRRPAASNTRDDRGHSGLAARHNRRTRRCALVCNFVVGGVLYRLGASTASWASAATSCTPTCSP